MLLPTLTGVVVNAPVASADPPPEQDWWNRFDGLGLTKLDTRIDITGDYWKTFAIVHPQQHSTCNYGSNLANQAETAAHLGGTVQTMYAPGSTGNFCIEVNEGWAGSTSLSADTYSSVTFRIADDHGNLLPGSYVMNNPGGWHQQQSASISVQMDAEPFDGAADAALAPGWYEMYLELTTQYECTPSACSSRGDGNTYKSGMGYFYVGQGYLWGAHPDGNSTSELTQEQASGGLNKNMSLVRDYKSTWDTPSARVNTWAGEGKSVVWSAKPPAWSGSDSPWKRAKNDTTMIRSQIQSLQNSAKQTGGPAVMFYAVSHEPHDDANDTTQGWNNGASNRKCGSTTSPSVGDASHDPCLGTAAEFKALYHEMRMQQQSSCNSTGGTTGTLGFRCDKVLIAYIGVTSNITPGANVGDNDTMRPASDDFDIIGGDVFNWGCFRKSAGTCTDASHGGNHEWKTFEQLIDDPSSSANNELLDLAVYLDKPVIITEMGSHPGCNGTGDTAFNCNGANTQFFRSVWFAQMNTYLELDREANKYILGWSYFHEFQSHDWRFVDTTVGGDVDNRGLTEYKAMISDLLYRSTAAGYDVTLRTPVPDSKVYKYSTARVETPYAVRDRNTQRPRHGASHWTPRDIGFAAWRTTFLGLNVNKFKMTFQYHQPHHQKQQDAYMQTLEITADIPCINGDSPWGGDWIGWAPSAAEFGYETRMWNTNIPAEALPYEDNMFFESENLNPWDDFANFDCGDDNKISIGFGVGNVNRLVNNTEYWVEFGTYCETSCTSNTAVDIKAQAGTMYDIEVWRLAGDNADCKWDPHTELAVWNDATHAAGKLRHEASWCAFYDYQTNYRFVEQGTLSTGSSTVAHVGADLLTNQGLEETPGIPGYGWIHGGGGTVNRAQYCPFPNTAYDGSCYVQFNGGVSGEASMYQDVTYPGPYFGNGKKTVYTAEAMLRCPTSNPGTTCPIAIAIRGRNGPGADEGVSITYPLPKDGNWYLCRLDYNHPDGPNTDTPGWGFVNNHSTLRWEIYNQSNDGRNLDIDYTYLGPRSREVDPRVDRAIPIFGWTPPGLNDIGTVGDILNDTPDNCYRATGTGAPIS